MEPKLIYYRPNTREAELISAKDLKRIHRVWGKRPYNFTDTFYEDHNYGTGLHIVTELMATMQNTQRLNERMNSLKERIKKGLTPSKSRFCKYVEEGLLFELIQDAKEQFIKDGGSMKEGEDSNKIHYIQIPTKEFMRLFNLPYKSVMDEVKKSEEEIGIISKPDKIRKVKYSVGYSSQCGSYKLYNVKGKLNYEFQYGDGKKKAYEKFHFLGKLHQSMFGENNIQIYLYDQAHRNWGLQNVVDFLVKKRAITLNYK